MQGSSVVASGEDEGLLRARSTRMSSTKSPTTKPKSCLAAAGGHHRPHLLAAASHDGIVLAQRQIPNKGSEIHEVARLVADLDQPPRPSNASIVRGTHRSGSCCFLLPNLVIAAWFDRLRPRTWLRRLRAGRPGRSGVERRLGRRHRLSCEHTNDLTVDQDAPIRRAGTRMDAVYDCPTCSERRAVIAVRDLGSVTYHGT